MIFLAEYLVLRNLGTYLSFVCQRSIYSYDSKNIRILFDFVIIL